MYCGRCLCHGTVALFHRQKHEQPEKTGNYALNFIMTLQGLVTHTLVRKVLNRMRSYGEDTGTSLGNKSQAA